MKIHYFKIFRYSCKVYIDLDSLVSPCSNGKQHTTLSLYNLDDLYVNFVYFAQL